MKLSVSFQFTSVHPRATVRYVKNGYLNINFIVQYYTYELPRECTKQATATFISETKQIKNKEFYKEKSNIRKTNTQDAHHKTCSIFSELTLRNLEVHRRFGRNYSPHIQSQRSPYYLLLASGLFNAGPFETSLNFRLTTR
jgi:hypothetical protein